MKFYFDGDSFTYGGSLDKVGAVAEEVRWSKLVCDHFGAEEINLSTGGASNDAVMRHTFGQPTTEVHDFYFFQTTIPSRGEIFDPRKHRWEYPVTGAETGNEGWIKYGLNEDVETRCMERWGPIEGPKFIQWMRFGFSRVHNEHYGRTKETITYNALKAYVASIGRARRSFFSTLVRFEKDKPCTDNKYDLYHINKINNWPKHKVVPPELLVYDKIPNDGHPSVEGHKTIAKYIIDIVSERLSDEGSVC
jgi:hypothetical protein